MEKFSMDFFLNHDVKVRNRKRILKVKGNQDKQGIALTRRLRHPEEKLYLIKVIRNEIKELKQRGVLKRDAAKWKFNI